MSLKALELQIAIPKTFNAGKLADEHQQNVIQQQYHANENLKKEEERKRLAVLNSEKMDTVSDEGKNQQEHGEGQYSKKERQEDSQEKEAKHPFKGNFFDYSR